MGLTNGITMVTAAQQALPIAKSVLGPLALMSTDFSTEMADTNYQVQVPLFDVGAVDTTENSYETDASPSITAKTITLNKYQSNDFPLKGLDKKKLGNVDAMAAILEGQFYVVCAAVVADILSLVTNANYGAAGWTGAAADFDIDAVVDLRTACKTFPKINRGLILPSTYTGAIMKDTKYTGLEGALGLVDPFKTGALPPIRGFSLAECDVVPANAENLVGFALHRSAIAVAMAPNASEVEGETEITAAYVATDPETKISLGIYEHINTTTRVRWISTEARYGYAKGTALLSRITSA